MPLTKHIAKHLSQVYYGKNWTWSWMEEQLKDVDWKLATTKIGDLNTIVALVYHIHYFVKSVIPVLEGGELDAHDKYSFDHPPINSEEEWQSFLQKVNQSSKKLSELIEGLDDEKMWETFSQEKYGNYFRNLMGIVEHAHYHLGQIVIIKKLLLSGKY